ncbi:MAG: hypothetical protein HY763_12880 [Planctomycetes bacterium]|nr:hypothetical protein [Planctomycetota bacterium]
MRPTLTAMALSTCVLIGCKEEPAATVPATSPEAPPATEETSAEAAHRDREPGADPWEQARHRLAVEMLEPADRWLVVEEARQGAPGAWATGSFDRERNRITIRTKDVERFALHLAMVPVDWEKLVILRIDGSSSELRKRETSVLHLMRDAQRRWVVIE